MAKEVFVKVGVFCFGLALLMTIFTPRPPSFEGRVMVAQFARLLQIYRKY